MRAEREDVSRAARAGDQVVSDVNTQVGMPLLWVGPHSRQKGRHEERKRRAKGPGGVKEKRDEPQCAAGLLNPLSSPVNKDWGEGHEGQHNEQTAFWVWRLATVAGRQRSR